MAVGLGHLVADEQPREPGLPPDESGEPLAERLAAELEVVGVAAVLVVVVDPADDLEIEVLVELKRLSVRRAGVTGDRPVLLGDVGDESLGVAATAVVRVDGEKEDVPVLTDGRERDQLVACDEEVRRRPPVRVDEEAAPLSEDSFGGPDPLFELPRRGDELRLAGRVHLLFDGYAH